MVGIDNRLGRTLRRAAAGLDGWTLGSLALAGLLLAPLVAVAWMALFPTENVWPHLVATVLPVYLINTVALMAMVALGTAAIGTGAAWLVVMTEFPGRRALEWALLAPLAVPAYIGAYALVDFLEYAGPVQTGLRTLMGWQSARDYWFPEIRSIWAAGFVLTMALYPYVYFLARAGFREQSVCALEVGRTLGLGPWGVFRRVGLPLARPAVAAGTALAMMETLNDFGAVDYFAVQTLTRGVFSVWLETFNAGGAAQISLVMLGFVLLLLVLERVSRRGRRFHHASRRYQPIRRARPKGAKRWLIAGLCALPVLFGFVLPVAVIGSYAGSHLDAWAAPAFWRAALHTGTLAATAAVVACAVGVFMVYGARASGHAAARWLAQATALGYAAPGAVLAVGVLIPLAALDHRLADAAEARLGLDLGLVLTGSAAAVVFAYVVRFAAIAHGAVDSALGRVTPSMEAAARTLGETRGGTLARVHLPLIRGSVLTAGLLIFVDSAKELPATLILRPFDFDTLATLVYGAASREQLAEAAPAALAIIAVGLLPVALLARMMQRTRPGEGAPHAVEAIG